MRLESDARRDQSKGSPVTRMKKNNLRQLSHKCRATGSSSVAIRRNEESVFAWQDDQGSRPIELMSVTKMIVGVIIGAALGDDAIAALSTPLTAWFPEWADDARSAITLRHVLTHTSGLKVLPSVDVYHSENIVQLALTCPLVSTPGSEYRYSNSTFNLLAAVLHRAVGKRLDHIAAERLFDPLGFSDWSWQMDSAGNPLCMAGLSAGADDIAKIGEVLLGQGSWKGRQLIPAHWVVAMEPKPPADVGLACFAQHEIFDSRLTGALLDTWTAAGVDVKLVEAVRPYADSDADPQEWRSKVEGDAASRLAWEVQSRGLKLADHEVGPRVGYGHDGDLGQYLIVIPRHGVVAVRLREELDGNSRGTSWPTFLTDVVRSFHLGLVAPGA
jgi:CubicO group peptidase (beta-lactamase class C family)